MTIVVVNYESWPDVVRLSRSLRDEPELRAGACEVLVVDNASRGPIPAELAASGGDLRLIARPDNGGFAVGVNAGWRQARGSWLLVLNPDVDVAPGFLRRVFARLDHHEARPDGPPGIVGLALMNPDGSPQGSVGAFPSLARSIREQFRPRSHRKYRPGWNLRAGSVDWVTGACMLVHATLMREVNGMDEDFFLYHEEVALCRVARSRGWRVEFDPAVRVIHRHPLQNRPISPKMRVITRHSKLLYFRKHLPRWQFRTLAAIIRCDSAIRGRWAAVRGRPEETRAWKVVAEVARRLGRGDLVPGREILALASETGEGSGPEEEGPWPGTRRPCPAPRTPRRNPGGRGSVRASS